MSLDQLLVIQAGGAIDAECSSGADTLAPASSSAAIRILAAALPSFDVEHAAVPISNSNPNPGQEQLAERIAAAGEDSKVLVTHEAHNIVECAAALARILGAAHGSTVVLTGAMRPERFR